MIICKMERKLIDHHLKLFTICINEDDDAIITDIVKAIIADKSKLKDLKKKIVWGN